MASPSRTTRWSSAMRTRIGWLMPARSNSTRKPLAGRLGGERAAEQLGPLAHAGEPVAAAAGRAVGRLSSVAVKSSTMSRVAAGS